MKVKNMVTFLALLCYKKNFARRKRLIQSFMFFNIKTTPRQNAMLKPVMKMKCMQLFQHSISVFKYIPELCDIELFNELLSYLMFRIFSGKMINRTSYRTQRSLGYWFERTLYRVLPRRIRGAERPALLTIFENLQRFS